MHRTQSSANAKGFIALGAWRSLRQSLNRSREEYYNLICKKKQATPCFFLLCATLSLSNYTSKVTYSGESSDCGSLRTASYGAAICAACFVPQKPYLPTARCACARQVTKFRFMRLVPYRKNFTCSPQGAATRKRDRFLKRHRKRGYGG